MRMSKGSRTEVHEAEIGLLSLDQSVDTLDSLDPLLDPLDEVDVFIQRAGAGLLYIVLASDSEYSREFKKKRILFSITLLLTIGVSGLVLCAVGSDLKSIAHNLGNADVAILGANAFLSRGVGSLIGTVCCAVIFERLQGAFVLFTCLMTLSVIIFLIPYTASESQLFLYFGILGFGSAINDTGVNILTRQLHGKHAGPWLGANGISFGMTAAVVPIIEAISANFEQQYQILSLLICIVAGALLYTAVSMNKYRTMLEVAATQVKTERASPHFRVELAVGFMCFCVVGAQVNTVAFIDSYLELTRVVAPRLQGKVLMVFWVCVGVGRVLGVLDQRYLIASDRDLVHHLSACYAMGAAALLPLYLFSSSAAVLWVSISVFALSFGPCISFCYDLNNRLTFPTEKSTAIVMFGVNLGASFVPYISGFAWKLTGETPHALITIISMCMVAPLTVIFFVKSMSYQNAETDN